MSEKNKKKEKKPRKPLKKKGKKIVTMADAFEALGEKTKTEDTNEVKTVPTNPTSPTDPKMLKAFTDLAAFHSKIPDQYLNVISAPEAFVAHSIDGVSEDFRLVLLMINYHILLGCYQYFVVRIFHSDGVVHFLEDLKKYWSEKNKNSQSLAIFITKAIVFCDYMTKLIGDLQGNYTDLVLDWYNDKKISKEKVEQSLNIYNAVMSDKDRFLQEKESLKNALKSLSERGHFGLGGKDVI